MKKFSKNLYQSLSFAIAELIIILPISIAFLFAPPERSGVAVLAIGTIVAMLFLYFAVGFYWIFQSVEIGKEGISVTLFGKVLRFIPWSSVLLISEDNVMRNPVFRLHIKAGKPLHLDLRKKIKVAIEENSCHRIFGALCSAEIVRIEKNGFYSENALDTDKISLLKEEITQIALERKDSSSFLPSGQCILLRYANGMCDILASEKNAAPRGEETPSLPCDSWLLCSSDGIQKIEKFF